jgi:NitT/TauT family transport system permease protein
MSIWRFRARCRGGAAIFPPRVMSRKNPGMAPGTMSERIASVAGLRGASDEGKLRLMAESPITTRPAVRAASGRLVTILLPWLALLALWYAVRASGLVSAALVPTPGEVVTRFWNLLWQGTLALDILMSTQRVLIGVALGIALAVPVGFVLGWYRQVRSFIDPLINFFRALPPIALIPLVIVYFGIGEPAKVVILFYASFFAGVIVMYEGIAQISPIFVRVARTLGASDGEIFRKVIVPMAVPHVLTALRVALGVAWATLVASELIAAQQGLGAVIQDAAAFFQLDIIYVGIICIGFIALAMDLALRAVTRRLVSWQERIAA